MPAALACIFVMDATAPTGRLPERDVRVPHTARQHQAGIKECFQAEESFNAAQAQYVAGTRAK